MIESTLFYLTSQDNSSKEWSRGIKAFDALFLSLKDLFTYDELKYHKYTDPYKIEVYASDMSEGQTICLLSIFKIFANKYGMVFTLDPTFI